MEDELIREYENGIKPEHWHKHEDPILEERERALNMVRYWNKKRKSMTQPRC